MRVARKCVCVCVYVCIALSGIYDNSPIWKEGHVIPVSTTDNTGL